ncbi:MAG: hypothetical protein AB2L09_11115 [Coriobacteriia bacterium]
MRPWPREAELPQYLAAAYEFLIGTVGERDALWLVSEKPVTPKVLHKHLAQLEKLWDGPIVAIFGDLTSSQRQRLVAAGIAFVVPDRQVYLPMLGLDLRERTRRQPEERATLRPAAQALLIWLLYRGAGVVHSSNDVIQALGYERMTLSRSVNELEAAGALVAGSVRKPKTFRLAGPPKAVWDAMQERLTNPVLRVVGATRDAAPLTEAPLAGLSALSRYSNLAEPAVTIRALPSRLLNKLAPTLTASDEDAEDTDLIEAWKYDPKLLTENDVVDPLSLYLTLRDTNDERIEQALEEMLMEVRW